MKLVTAQEMKEIDKLATEKYGVPSILLMDAAAKVVADEVASILGECFKCFWLRRLGWRSATG